MIWRALDHRHHPDNFTDFIGSHVGAHGYHRLKTAQALTLAHGSLEYLSDFQ